MSGRTTRVLVIDDNADVRATIKWLLESEGFSVALAANGTEGLEQQKDHPASIVVTDIFMPEKDGIETIFELRREYPQAKIIVMSGGSSRGADFTDVARELGAAVALKKPVDPAVLIAHVHRLARAPDEPG
jgi:CheY-like chemotaxis protein